MYPRSEILFPRRCVRGLSRMLDQKWDELVDVALRADEGSEEGLAFSLMMMRLCGCLTCDMGSYKASLGCDTCSRRAVMACHGNVPGLQRRFEKARQDVIHYLRYGETEPAEEPTADSFAA